MAAVVMLLPDASVIAPLGVVERNLLRCFFVAGHDFIRGVQNSSRASSALPAAHAGVLRATMHKRKHARQGSLSSWIP